MAIQRVPISIFVSELEAALKRKDGYIMGAYGQNPKTGSLDLSVTKESNSWKTSGWYYTQYNTGYSAAQKKKALYWRENATRVWDCNGLAEGIYQLYTGKNINSKARYNYSDWCDPKGSDMSKIPKEPGVAVFKYSTSAGYITHVGYLWKPIKANNPDGDWYVIEAKGVLYGVVRTTFNSGGWNRWGKMTKYYDYNDTITEPIKTEPTDLLHLQSGMSGAIVKELQQLLVAQGFKLPKYGIDGEFGNETKAAVEAFQTAQGLIPSGIVDDITKNLLLTQKKQVKIVNGNCYIRVGPTTAYKSIGVAHKGDIYLYGGITKNKWLSIYYKNSIAYVSNKYSQLI